ncbi:MAG: type II secretion system protein [Planctomycetota bacterium]|nr:type II secretion system protein [Planctomycetota bacterium]
MFGTAHGTGILMLGYGSTLQVLLRASMQRRTVCIIERRGFTLIEMLVSIAIVTVLMSLAIPSLRAARLGAESSVCLSQLRGLGQGLAMEAGQNGGIWMNLFDSDMDASTFSFVAGQVEYETPYFGQVRLWPGGLIGTLWEEGDPAEVWTCPAVLRKGYGLSSGSEQLERQPADGGIASYFYSPGLFSDWKLWDPEEPGRLDDPDRFRRRVGVHEVRFPSRKASMAEVADFHGRRILLASNPGISALSVLLCDGHVQRVRATDAAVTLPTRFMFDVDPEPEVVPFLGTPYGVHGDDFGLQEP